MFSFFSKITKKLLLGCFIVLAFLGPTLSVVEQKITYQTPISYAQTTDPNADLALSDDYGISCGFFDGSSLTGCFTYILYGLFYIPTSYGVTLSARMQDYFIFLSIKDTTYRSPIIEEGWRVLRDFSNLIFIFGIIYVAISFILGLGGGQKKQLVNILIFATLINFSLFAGRLIVDFGNVFAFAIYEQINVVSVGSSSDDAVKAIGTGFLSISNPTKVMSAITNIPTDSLESTMNIILIFGTLFNIGMITIFISVGFLFLKRILGIYVYLIFSSLAFASKALPNSDQILKDIGLRKWFNSLLQMSISGGIYMLFVYLAINFLNSGLSLVSAPQADNQIVQILFDFTITFALTFMFLQKGKDYLKSALTEISQAVDGYASKAAGLALGITAGAGMLAGKAVLGGAKFIGKNKAISGVLNREAGRNTRIGKALTKYGFSDDGKTISQRITDAAAKAKEDAEKGLKPNTSGLIARNMIRAGNRLDRANFDVRNTGVGAGLSRLGSGILGKGIDESAVPGFLKKGGSLSRSRIDNLKEEKKKLLKWAEDALLKEEMAQIHDSNAEAENRRQKEIDARRKEFDKKIEGFEEDIIKDAEESVGRVLTFEERNSMRLSEQERTKLHKEYLKNGKIDAVIEERSAKDSTGAEIAGTKIDKKSLSLESEKKGKLTINESTESAYVKAKKIKEAEISAMITGLEDKGELDEKYKQATEDAAKIISKEIAAEIEAALSAIGVNLTQQQKDTLQDKGEIDNVSGKSFYNYQKELQAKKASGDLDLKQKTREALIDAFSALGINVDPADKTEILTSGKLKGQDAFKIYNYNAKRKELEEEARVNTGSTDLTKEEESKLNQIIIDGTFDGKKLERPKEVKEAEKKIEEERRKIEKIKSSNTYNGTNLGWHTDLQGRAAVQITSGEKNALELAKIQERESARKTGNYNGEKLENTIESERIKDEQAERLIQALTDLGTNLTAVQKDDIKKTRKYLGYSNNNYLNYLDKQKELEEKGITITPSEKDSILERNQFHDEKLKNLAEEAQRLGTINGEKIQTIEEKNGFSEKKWELSAALNSKIINQYLKEKRGLKDREDALGQVYSELTEWRDGLYGFKNDEGVGNLALKQLEDRWGKGSENIQRVTEIRDRIKAMNEEMFSQIEEAVSGLNNELLVNEKTGEKGDDFKQRFKKEAGDVSRFFTATQELKDQSLIIALEEAELKIEETREDIRQIRTQDSIEARNKKLKLKQLQANQENLRNTEKKIRELEKLAAEISQRYATKDE